MTIVHQVENTKREAGVIIQNQLYIMQLKRTEIQMETSPEKENSKTGQAEGISRDPKDWLIDIIQSGQKGAKKQETQQTLSQRFSTCCLQQLWGVDNPFTGIA